jgi:hypothetical protein
VVTGISFRWIRLSKTTPARNAPSPSRYTSPSWNTISEAGAEGLYCAGTYTQNRRIVSG